MKRCREYIFLTILVLLLVLLYRFSVLQSIKTMFISDELRTSKCPQTPKDLQYAIDTASSGDTIELLPITYEGNFLLRSRNPGDKITIRGKRDSISNSDIIINGRNGQTIINNIYTYINGKLISHSHSGKGTQHSTIQANGTALKIVQGIWDIESLSIVSGDVGIEIVNGNQNTLTSLWIQGVNTGVIIVGNGNHVRSTGIEANWIGISIRGSGNKIQSSDVVAQNTGILIEGSRNAIQGSDVDGMFPLIKEIKVIR
jgi:hypothetical protein